MNIFVAKLSYSTTQETLKEAFESYGDVDSVKIIFDKEANRSKGFGFVEMPNDDEAKAAIEALDGSDIDGRTISVKVAQPREEGAARPRFNGPRPGGGGGGSRFGDKPRTDRGDRFGGGGGSKRY